MSRFFVPLVLLAVAVATLLVSNRLAEEPAVAVPRGVATADVPLLSARRLPTVVTTHTPEPLPPLRQSTLERDLTALVLHAPARTCIAIRQDGDDLFVHESSDPLHPASLQKLVTAQAALAALGADYTYRTTAIAESAPVGGVLPNDLFLVGAGDPLLATLDYAALLASDGASATPLDNLAGDLVGDGLVRIEGGVVAVDTHYDENSYIRSWPADWVRNGVAGTLNAVALNQGYQTPPGLAGRVGLLPEPEPALRTAALFDDMLEARAVRIPERPEVAARDRDFTGFIELGAVESAPLGAYLEFMLRESDNTTAELLLKELGFEHTGRGTTLDGALAALEILAEDAGRPILVFPPADGSGASPDNELTCGQVVEILEIDGPEGLLASYLPVAGQSGTLEHRFVDSTAAGRVRAKTGSLPGVRSLAGFATGSDGRPITFAAILNGESLAAVTADQFLQQLLEILVAHPNYEDSAGGVTDGGG